MLQKLGKKIVIISNSSRRKGDTLARLRAMGFGPCEDEDEEAGLGRPGDVPPISGVFSRIRTDLPAWRATSAAHIEPPPLPTTTKSKVSSNWLMLIPLHAPVLRPVCFRAFRAPACASADGW